MITEAGIALNPKHKNYQEIKEDLASSGIQTASIDMLQKTAERLTGVPRPVEVTDRIVGIVEYRDGTVLDVIRELSRKK